MHALVTAGGLANHGSRWVPSSKKYLFPVQVMGALLRGKMMAALRTLHERGTLASCEDFADSEAFGRLMQKLARTPWVVYAKRPFREIDLVFKYRGATPIASGQAAARRPRLKWPHLAWPATVCASRGRRFR